MTIDIQREDLGTLEPEWRELLPRCSLAKVFASPTWVSTWWQHFGSDRELMLLSARRDGDLIGVIPLMRDGDALSFAGDTKVCDYMDLLTPPTDRTDLLTALLRSLSEERWQQLNLWAVPEGSATLEALPSVCADLGIALQIELEDVCPQIELPDDWEEYVSSLDKKNRHELRRKLRRLPQGEVELEILTEQGEVDEAMDDFVRLHTASRADKAAFMTGAMEQFFRAIVRALAQEALIEMIFVRLGRVRAASVVCFKEDSQVLLYNSGYDPSYSHLSVGLLSKALVLQKAIESGRRRFDFLRGSEPYKYDLGARDVNVYRCTVHRS